MIIMIAVRYFGVCVQVIEWFEEYAEEFFQTHTELGDSLEVAQALTQEVSQFEESTQVSLNAYFTKGCFWLINSNILLTSDKINTLS